MVIEMKGMIFRGLKIIAQIFTVQREHEIEIGYPTDVRHLSHVGLGTSDSCPSWMSEFRGVEEVTAGGRSSSTVGSFVQPRHSSWASLDFEQPASTGVEPPTVACGDCISWGQGGNVTTKKAARPRRASQAPSPAGSSSCGGGGHSGDLRVPAGLQDA